jgi:hypothetical protein
LVGFIKTFVDTEVRHEFEGSTTIGLIVSMHGQCSLNGPDAGWYGNGKEQEVARAKIFHWIYLEVNVSTEDDGAFKVEVLFAD